MQAPALRRRSHFPAASRKIRFIAPEELQLAIAKVVADSIAIYPEAAANGVAKLFGFQRVTEDMRQEIMEAIRQAIKEQRILLEGEVLRMG